jgi:hypothetical protein
LEWFGEFRRVELAALAGVGLLLLLSLTAVPRSREPLPGGETPRWRALWVVGLFALGTAVGVMLVERAVRGAGLVPRTSEMSARLKYGLNEIHKSAAKPVDNLVFIGGGSHVAYGVDTKVLGAGLRKRGYSVRVVQLGARGANHFERRQLYLDLVNHPMSELADVSAQTRVMLMEEVQLNYDLHPLAQVDGNLASSRVYHYMTPRTGIEALRALYWGGGEERSLATPEWELLSHVMVHSFHAGGVDRLMSLDGAPSREGYKPFGSRRFEFRGTQRAAKATTQKVLERHDLPWLEQIREPGVKAAFGERLDGWVYFTVATTYADYVEHNRQFCAATEEACIPLDDPALFRGLNKRADWHDPGHLSSKGAKKYSRWLAGRLAETGVLQK